MRSESVRYASALDHFYQSDLDMVKMKTTELHHAMKAITEYRHKDLAVQDKAGLVMNQLLDFQVGLSELMKLVSCGVVSSVSPPQAGGVSMAGDGVAPRAVSVGAPIPTLGTREEVMDMVADIAVKEAEASARMPDWYFCASCNRHMDAGDLGSVEDRPGHAWSGLVETLPSCAHCNSTQVEPVTLELIQSMIRNDHTHPIVQEWYEITGEEA